MTRTPAPAPSPASALYLAQCAACRTPYKHPWKRVLPPDPR